MGLVVKRPIYFDLSIALFASSVFVCTLTLCVALWHNTKPRPFVLDGVPVVDAVVARGNYATMEAEQ